jgi:hypothetical protein
VILTPILDSLIEGDENITVSLLEPQLTGGEKSKSQDTHHS